MWPSDLDRSRRFYRDVLGLAIYREFGPSDDPRAVYFLGPGLLEVGPRTKYFLIAQRGRWCQAECRRDLVQAGCHGVRARWL